MVASSDFLTPVPVGNGIESTAASATEAFRQLSSGNVNNDNLMLIFHCGTYSSRQGYLKR